VVDGANLNTGRLARDSLCGCKVERRRRRRRRRRGGERPPG